MRKTWFAGSMVVWGLLLSGCSESEESARADVPADITLENDINSEQVIIKGSSSLPYQTKMTVALSNEEGLISQQIVEAGPLGGFESKDFLEQKPVLTSGSYIVTVSSLPSSEQNEAVQDVIGPNGESLVGGIVKEIENGEKVASVEDTVSITVLDPTKPVTFQNGDFTVGKDILPGKYLIHTEEPEAGGLVSIFREDGQEVFNDIMGTHMQPPLQFNDVEVELREKDSIKIGHFKKSNVVFTPVK